MREAFDEYLRCGVLDHGFLRVACEHCHAERLVAFSCKKRGSCPSCGAVTLVQHFGSALNLNVHFHMLWLDGVYEPDAALPAHIARHRR